MRGSFGGILFRLWKGDFITEGSIFLGYNENTKNKSRRYPYELRRIDPEQKVRP